MSTNHNTLLDTKKETATEPGLKVVYETEEGEKYTYNDVLEIAGGSDSYAQTLIDRATGQNLETLCEEDEREDYFYVAALKAKDYLGAEKMTYCFSDIVNEKETERYLFEKDGAKIYGDIYEDFQVDFFNDQCSAKEVNVENLPSKEEREIFIQNFIEAPKKEISYQSELTGEIYTGVLSSYYNEHKDETQLYIGEALVQTISGKLDGNETDYYFEEYFPAIESDPASKIAEINEQGRNETINPTETLG